MESRIARLVVQQGQTPNMEYLLGKSVITIGRSSVSDITINDTDISRTHARIVRNETGYIVEDMESTNGTFVNDQAVTNFYTLRDGDLISLGDSFSFLFLENEDALIDTDYPYPNTQDDLESSIDTSDGTARPLPIPPDSFDSTEEAPKPTSASRRHQEEAYQKPTRWWLSCGCFFILLFIIFSAVIYALDFAAPDILYCGPLQPFFTLIASLFDLVPNCP